MLFRASAALVLTLLSIAASASPKAATRNVTSPKTAPVPKHSGTTTTESQPPQGLPGPTGITITPMDHQNFTAGHSFLLKYQGFERVTLQSAAINIRLTTKNGLNELVLATDMGAQNKQALFRANFLLPKAFHVLATEVGQPLQANVDIYERDEQFFENGTFMKFQTRFLAQAPIVIINHAGIIHNKKKTW